MKLELRSEYHEYSVGGGRTPKRKMKNICPSKYEELYLSGYSHFFTVVEDKPLSTQKKVIKNEINIDEDDTNQ